MDNVDNSFETFETKGLCYTQFTSCIHMFVWIKWISRQKMQNPQVELWIIFYSSNVFKRFWGFCFVKLFVKCVEAMSKCAKTNLNMNKKS